MRRFALELLLAVLILLGTPTVALSAQEAMVTIEQAPIREKPAVNSTIIESRASGERIRVSSYNREGWYKVKTSSGQYGWIWQGDIALTSFSDDVAAANLELQEREHNRRHLPEPPRFMLRGSLNLSPILIAQVDARKGNAHATFGGFGEFQLRVSDGLRLALRLMSYVDVTRWPANSITDADVEPGHTLGLIGFEQDVSGNDKQGLSVGAYGGFTLASSMTVRRIDAQLPTTTAIDNQGYALLLNLVYKRHLKNWLELVGEGGILYTYHPKMWIPYFGQQHVSEYGLTFSLGLQVGI